MFSHWVQFRSIADLKEYEMHSSRLIKSSTQEKLQVSSIASEAGFASFKGITLEFKETFNPYQARISKQNTIKENVSTRISCAHMQTNDHNMTKTLGLELFFLLYHRP
ncbi:hypothetical protein BDB00DRAFT_134247 [Zychaea mexicana]|uniref:uncharacterized protein n=1 Tax=Zychaea mexicana TaxID=64656 RepID=UPI0022FEF9C5|nr:uncharacterized protein BDB00DRAFT_134247 [Zychaea mexicana]KAI9484452.1 hypothetical protein BDB00DRAFT_134247 [Zychaea mexicana]